MAMVHQSLDRPLTYGVSWWRTLHVKMARCCSQCLNCREGGVRGLNPFPNCFLNPLNTLSDYVLGVSYILYTYNLHHNFGRTPTVEEFNPPANFSLFKNWVLFIFGEFKSRPLANWRTCFNCLTWLKMRIGDFRSLAFPFRFFFLYLILLFSRPLLFHFFSFFSFLFSLSLLFLPL